MYTNNKNIKTTLFIVALLLIIFMLFIKYDTDNYIDERAYEYEEQFILYQEQLDSYFKSASGYISELLDSKNELLDIKKELSDIKKGLLDINNELSNINNELLNINNELGNAKKELEDVKKDVTDLKEQIKNITSSNNGSPDTSGNKLYVGRLYIPTANISVALYSGWAQEITDRDDSANYFSFNLYSNDNMIIADHNNQEFSKLFKVKIGTTGYIKFKDGSIDNIKCVEILSGYNKKKDITDKNGNSVTKKEDYLMYTCQNGWENILICLWTIV